MLFDGWYGIARTVVVGVLAYLSLVALLRVSGKRTLSKMNAFDLVVTVALGSTLATILLSDDVALLEGLGALAVLVMLQFGIAWLTVRSRKVAHWVKSEPTLLVYEGCLLGDALVRERVTEAEVLSALRSKGIADLAMVGAVVLETDGSFTVVPNIGDSRRPTLQSVRGWQPRRSGTLR